MDLERRVADASVPAGARSIPAIAAAMSMAGVLMDDLGSVLRSTTSSSPSPATRPRPRNTHRERGTRMTTIPTPTPLRRSTSSATRIWWLVRNTLVLAHRGVARIIREPSQLLDVTLQPLIFVLLFVYVFGSAIRVPGGGNYHEYLIGGMFGMALVGTAQGTAVGVSTDMATGLTDRFRSLPIARSAVLAGRVITDLLDRDHRHCRPGPDRPGRRLANP